MAHPIWPLFDLRVTTPRLELRYLDDELAEALAVLAATGVHDPGFMPFAVPWTDVPPPQQEWQTQQFYWRCRADLSPASWTINLATLVDGVVVGTTSLMAKDFPTLRLFETGSWLGREHQGRGIGKEMRLASLHLGFAGLGAQWATTGAFDDNGPSLGVTRSLGYAPKGHERRVRRGQPATTLRFEMARAHFEQHLLRDDVVLHGVEPCLPLLGLG
ncbi:MAG: GNAT family N-acetyltransferase [Ilumatobacter sp.]|nr:GNAT family N-acetyltransferase [Ilumatobacter sp.]MCB0985989.1 GNAT family N-acetyltransferase [Ilumatobacter sp.]